MADVPNAPTLAHAPLCRLLTFLCSLHCAQAPGVPLNSRAYSRLAMSPVRHLRLCTLLALAASAEAGHGVETGCFDDSAYFDAGWNCGSWNGYACRSGGWGVATTTQIANLVHACPRSCTDVTPICTGIPSPPLAPPPPPSPPGLSGTYAPAQGCGNTLDILCASLCPVFPGTLARLDGPAGPTWRCYSPSTLNAALSSYVSGSQFCTRDGQLRSALATCIASLRPPPPTLPPPYLPPPPLAPASAI